MGLKWKVLTSKGSTILQLFYIFEEKAINKVQKIRHFFCRNPIEINLATYEEHRQIFPTFWHSSLPHVGIFDYTLTPFPFGISKFRTSFLGGLVYWNPYRYIFVRSSSFCRKWGEYVVYKNCSECQKQFLYTTCSPQVELGIFMYWTCNSMKILSSYCGLVDAKIRASDKDLPVRVSVY